MGECHWRLKDEDYEFIKGEVAHLFVKYRVKCIPVSGFEIAAKMGITMSPYSSFSGQKLETCLSASQDGFFLEYNGREYIYYNDITQSYERQNWTLLHEIGHIVLDHVGHGAREEAEADFFAKYAIAPPVLIYKIKAQSPADIYEAFNISMEAAGYAFEYYLKWRQYQCKSNHYASYEMKLLQLYENLRLSESA